MWLLKPGFYIMSGVVDDVAANAAELFFDDREYLHNEQDTATNACWVVFRVGFFCANERERARACVCACLCVCM